MSQRLFYVVVNENVGDGLLQAQLLQPLQGSGLGDAVDVINIIHPLAKKRLAAQASVRVIRAGLPARAFQFKLGGLLELAVSWYYALLLFFVVPSGARVAARSYYSSLAVFLLSKLKRIDWVFDTRSQFVQENVSAGKLLEGSTAHRRWQRLELRMLCAARRVMAVSEAQAAYYRALVPGLEVTVVPCYGQPDYALLNEDARAQGRTVMGFASEDVVICYYGSLDRKWNHIDVYSSFFADCLARGFKLCILTPSAEALKADARLATPAAFIRRIDDPMAARRLMNACDHGVIVMSKGADWESRLGVKFVEYLCAGLGVMVGRWVGAAAQIARTQFASTSHILDADPPTPPPFLHAIDARTRLEIARRAETLFGYERMRVIFD